MILQTKHFPNIHALRILAPKLFRIFLNTFTIQDRWTVSTLNACLGFICANLSDVVFVKK